MSRIRADRYTNRAGTGAPTFSEGVNVVGVTSMSGDLAVTNGTITGPSQLTISGITSSISDTAVDVFVYDTSKDSDGGDWRKRTQNTSWYNETLNTATRGSRKEFPSVAVIVIDSTFDLTIYDGDDPDLPMWMKFENSGFLSWSTNGDCEIKTVSMLNGIFVTGGDDGDGGIHVNFVSDHVRTIFGNGNKYDITGAAPIISNRSATVGFVVNSAGDGIVIVNTNINDVAMTVLPNAPVDSATGLPVPTIAVATVGGTSVIRDDGTVADLSGFSPVTTVHIDENNVIGTSNSGTPTHDFIYKTHIPAIDEVYNAGITAGSYNYYMNSNNTTTPLLRDIDMTSSAYNSKDDIAYRGGTGGVDYINAAEAISNISTTSAIAYISKDYNTGYMQGDIKLATLSDTNATNQTGGTVADRSVNNNALNVTGTITRSAVATGADLVGYSGFSNNSNYLQQPYNSDLDFGTGDFSVTLWAYRTAGDTKIMFDRSRQNGTQTSRFSIYYDTSGSVEVYEGNGSTISASGALPLNVWTQITFVKSSSQGYLYENGNLVAGPTAFTTNHTDSTAKLVIGNGYNYTYGWEGSLALVRVSTSVPSPEQIKKMYEDEKYLFQENSQATLYGSSDAVTALAYDDTTNILHAGTSAGRSEFQGLRRINNTTTAVTTALSASNELVAEQ